MAKLPRLLKWLHPSKHGDNVGDASIQFYLGGPGTGAPFHRHDGAYNALIYGQKRWFLLPPSQALFSIKPAIRFLKDDYPAMQATGGAPTLTIPALLTTGTTIAITTTTAAVLASILASTICASFAPPAAAATSHSTLH